MSSEMVYHDFLVCLIPMEVTAEAVFRVVTRSNAEMLSDIDVRAFVSHLVGVCMLPLRDSRHPTSV